MPHRKIVLALDVPTTREALALATLLREHVGVFKVGLELFVAEGPAVVRAVAALGKPIFLDLKLHDIPETVERAVATAAALGVSYLTVHASGGAAMMARAASRAAAESHGSLTILAVTVLTSMRDEELAEVGVNATARAQVARLGHVAVESGVHGFVCSPHEAHVLREIGGETSVIATPGVRPSGSASGDQHRVATPAGAIEAGADLLVVGRPIRDALDPVRAARDIAAEIGATQRKRSET